MRGIKATRVARAGAAVAVCVGLGGCWFAPGQGPDRRAHNPTESTITAANVATLQEAWATDTGDRSVGPPVASPGRVHVSTGESLVTLDSAAGDIAWRVDVEFDPFETFGSPFVRGDQVVASSGYPNIGGNYQTRAFAADDGAARALPVSGIVGGVRASTAGVSLPAFGSGGPSVENVGHVDLETGEGWIGLLDFGQFGGVSPAGSLTVAPGGGLLQAGNATLDTAPTTTPQEGQGVRFFTAERPPNCAPPEAGSAYFPCPAWVTPVDAQPTAVVVTDPYLVVGTEAGTVYALDPADGAIAWSADVGDAVTAEPAFAEGKLYVVTTGGDLAVLDAATGATVWGDNLGAALSVQPAVAGDVLYVGGDDGVVRAYAAGGCGAATCDPLWQDDTGDTAITGAPAVSAGRLLVGTADGRVVSYTPG